MKRLLVCLLLLGSTAGAADFLEDLTGYRNHIRRTLHIDEAATAPLADSALNEFIRESVVTNMPLIQGEKVKVVDTLEGRVNTYTLDSTLLYLKSVVWNKYDSVKSLLYLPRELWYSREVKSTAGQDGYARIPSYYDYDDDFLYIYPTPNVVKNDTLEIGGVRKVPDLGAYDSLSVIPQAYRPVVALYATYLSARSISNPTTQLLMAEYQKALNNLNAVMNRRVMNETSGQ